MKGELKMMDSTGIQPVMPIGGNDLSGGSFIWIIMLFFLFLLGGNGFGGFGWGGNGALSNFATQNDMQRGFDAQNSIANQREILSAVNAGTAQSVATTNQTFHDTLGIIQNRYDELARDVSGIAVSQAQALANQNACCCETKQLIQTTSANTDAKIAENKYDTSMQMAQMEARLTAKMDANEIQSLRDKVQSLELANATANVIKFPTAWSYNGGYFPPISGCPCGGNI